MNMLRSRGVLDFAVVIDVFCGTGALGLEAISQGADSATFIDNSEDSLTICKLNIDALSLKQKALVLRRDATRLGKPNADTTPATLVFMDPPYKTPEAVQQCLQGLEDGWIRSGCILVAEIDKKYSLEIPLSYEILDQRAHGDTKIILLRYTKLPV